MDDHFSTDSVNALSADDFTGQRSGSRDSLMLTAQFRIAGDDKVVQARVRNLSSGGLMAEYASPVAAHTPVEIEVRGVGWVKGRIAWVTDGRVGVAFDIEIDPMLARKPVGKGAQNPAYTKPSLTRR
ncbi:PilZ domain-containing protein [Sphingomonas sp. LM7]|uniref:PilZ domain-containing protein n=1 Tax=Sphingomonas sp. LM7 TaxID=1938607 RepID=UPI000983FC1F|nr:PilZ domain-containing protein [Sphingomonas sp. LM7]AQR72785.1 PilZ domain-containing protein [Sphingomonas sp. LM7]